MLLSISPSKSALQFRSNFQLYPKDKVPKIQAQANPYITTGFRSYLSAKQCLVSIMLWSNELLNIWTHGVMFVVFFILLIYDQLIVLPSMGSNHQDHAVFFFFSVCCQACMLCSAGYHTFNSHLCESVIMKWFAIDIAGITVGMMGCYIIGIYYGFYCHSSLGTFYMVTMTLILGGSAFMITHPNYLSPEWKTKRHTHLTSLVLAGFIPLTHWTSVSTEADIKLFLHGVLTLYVILGIAMFFFVTKLPERFFPKIFDYVGQSHNLWHVFTAFAFVYWRSFALQVHSARLKDGCPTLPQLADESVTSLNAAIQ